MKTSSYSWQFTASKWLICLLVVVYVLALIAAFLNALQLIIQLILSTFILLHGWFTLKRFVHENWRLYYDDENAWQIIESNSIHSIEILPSTVISKMFIFLHYQMNDQKFYRIIFNDALLPSINDYRQLIVTLKTYR